MAFLVHSTKGGDVPAWEYKPFTAITPKIGMALVESSGQMAIATGTTKPTYICMAEKSAAVTAGDVLPVIKVTNDIYFQTTFSANASSVNNGDRVTLHASNGLQVTATTSSGVARVVSGGGGASGAACVVCFD